MPRSPCMEVLAERLISPAWEAKSLRLIAVDRRQRMDLAALEQAICADRAQGFTPFLVVGTAGTVDTGAIDDLEGIAELGARHQLWFHVDGAYGALAMLAPELAPRLKGIERADSLAFDFHKWAQVPYDAGFILVRDGQRQQQAFASSCAYLMREQRGMSAGSPWPCDLGPDLSRGFRALKTWATLKVYGMNAIGAVIQRSCELARYLERRILSSNELELMAPVELEHRLFPLPFRIRMTSLTSSIGISSSSCRRRAQSHPQRRPSRDRLSIRAAMVNHRTSQAEMDTWWRQRWPLAGLCAGHNNPRGNRGASGTAGYRSSMFYCTQPAICNRTLPLRCTLSGRPCWPRWDATWRPEATI